MFERSKIGRQYESGGLKRAHLNVSGLPRFILEEKDDPRPMRIAVTAAAMVVALMLVLRLPEVEPIEVKPQRVQASYVIQQVRFEPPAPQPQRTAPRPKEKKRIIPVPDETPDEPEPIRVAEEVEIDIELPEGEAVFGIPDAPPGFGSIPSGVMALDGNIVAPQKIFAPQPAYTEEARQARVQGVVILQAIVDAMGRVSNVKVLKGLPMGLSESAVETVAEWRYRPATLNGEPVPVYFNFTINFSLQ